MVSGCFAKRISGWRVVRTGIRLSDFIRWSRCLIQKPDMSPQKSDDCGGWSTDRKRINGWRVVYPLIRFLSVDHLHAYQQHSLSPSSRQTSFFNFVTGPGKRLAPHVERFLPDAGGLLGDFIEIDRLIAQTAQAEVENGEDIVGVFV